MNDASRIRRGQRGYPQLLSQIADPPQQITVRGRALGEAPYVAVVGSRRPTPYGLVVARQLASDLARAGAVIVSGMAQGIDSAAHLGALDAGGSTVAVLGCGIDVCYPRSNRTLFQRLKTEGTLVSEYEDNDLPLPYRFPERNRIIAGMSIGVVIVEGKVGGGAMITARLGLDHGREVFAVPGPVGSQLSAGPHQLIREGARLVTDAWQVLEDLQLEGRPDPGRARSISPDEHRVIAVLEPEPRLFDVIAARAKLPLPTAAAVLARLELDGLVVRFPGSRFALGIEVPNSS